MRLQTEQTEQTEQVALVIFIFIFLSALRLTWAYNRILPLPVPYDHEAGPSIGWMLGSSVHHRTLNTQQGLLTRQLKPGGRGG